MVRTNRFGTLQGYEPAPRSSGVRLEVFEPEKGLHSGEPPQALRRGFTPFSQNFVGKDGYITPRSGTTHFSDLPIAPPALSAINVFDSTAKEHILAASSTSFAWSPNAAGSWTVLEPDATSTPPSGLSSDYWQFAQVYDPGTDSVMVVATNLRDPPKYFYATEGTASYSNFSFAEHLLDRARIVTAFDNRLIWASIRHDGLNMPQRILWSARGQPAGYAIGTDGSGFEDLMEIRGEILAIIPDLDGLAIFTSEEIWRGRRRGDAYVFDFSASLRQSGGLFVRTIATTPAGIIFLGRDMELYVFSGSQLQPIGPQQSQFATRTSRVQAFLRSEIQHHERSFSYYNPHELRYELYYADADSSSGFPNKALYLHFQTNSYFPQRFSMEISTLARAAAVTAFTGLTWDEATETWNNMEGAWDDFFTGAGHRDPAPIFFQSNGSIHAVDSNATNDSGDTIDCRWRSHGLSQTDPFQFDQLYEVWTEYSAPSNSSASIFVSDTLGDNFLPGEPLSLLSSGHSVVMTPVFVTAPSPQFEVRLSDGGRPKISRLQARIREGGFWGGP